MQQRIVLFLCFVMGLSVWILIISGRQKSRDTKEKSNDTNREKGLQLHINTYPGHLNKAQLLILDITRLKIKLEFMHFNFTHMGVQKLEDLLMEYGGTPVRSLIVSNWRSGSSFLGDMVNVMSGNFYHFDPLLKNGFKKIRGPPYSNGSIRYLKSLFQCDHEPIKTYIDYWKTNSHTEMLRNLNPVQNNRRLWNICEIKDQLCFNTYFVASACRLFPFQSMKVVRLRLSLAKDVLKDRQLNVKVVLLVRDPRAVMEARLRSEPFCPKPECVDPAILCGDMVSDYVAAQELSRKYPNRFMVVYYEELMTNIEVIGLQLLRFLGLGPTSSFSQYLKKNGDLGFTIYSHLVYRWRTDLDFVSVAKIQEKCKDAMHLWDYELAQNASHLRSTDFYPLQKHSAFPLLLDEDDFDGSLNM